MSRPYKNYTDEEVIMFTAQSLSMGQLLDKLGLKKAGGNYANLRKTLQKLGLKCDHWQGKYGCGWNRGHQLKDWSQYNKISSVKKHLLKIKKCCEICELDAWLDKPLVLEVHHLNGDRTDNGLENLQVLCPNCHSQTSNFRNRKNLAMAV